MHITLPILGVHLLMGTDASESMGFKVHFGNNIYINLEPDTRVETNKLLAEIHFYLFPFCRSAFRTFNKEEAN